jgi:hypothetical protein
VLGALAATSYDTRIDALHLPARLAGAAKQSIGTATRSPTACPLGWPSAFLASTRGGFTSGIIVATVIGGAIVLAAAAGVALFLPARPKGPRHETGHHRRDRRDRP